MNSKSGRLRGLYGITDEQLLPHSHALFSAAEAAMRGGLSLLQYRSKSLPRSEQARQAETLRRLCDEYGVLLIINDDVELAYETGADGVHVGRHDEDIVRARARLGDQAIIGVSCYNELERALQAQQQGADYVAFGRFFASKTKPEAVPADVEILQQAKSKLDIPVCAIGGITAANGATLVDGGADMLAVIHDLFSRPAPSVEDQATCLSALLRMEVAPG